MEREQLNERRYQEKLALLRRFVAEHGHADVPTQYKVGDVALGAWVSAVRVKWRNETLSDERIKELDRLGFSWQGCRQMGKEQLYERRYQDKLAVLRDYVAEHGHADVPQQYKVNGVALGTWVNNVREKRRIGKLSDERIEELEQLGFIWDAHDSRIERFVDVLRQFIAVHGHANVPLGHVVDGVAIGNWCHWQRKQHRLGKVPASRIQRLDALGFVWEPAKARRAEPISLLRGFKAETGHLDVPYSFVVDGFRLGAWCQTQRRKYRRDALDHETWRELNALDFRWDARPRHHKIPGLTFDENFEVKFGILRRFVEANGHADVPYGAVLEGVKLGTWCSRLRARFHGGTLEADRISALENLRFQWREPANRAKDLFDIRLQILLKYIEQHGHPNVPDKVVVDGFCLGKWCTRQRSRRRAGTLTTEQIEQLDAVEFRWEPKGLVA